jgi:hypothetical protein
MLRGVEDWNASLEASSSEASAAAIRELRNILIILAGVHRLLSLP